MHIWTYVPDSTDPWAGYRNRYSDWLRSGRSGDRIPLGGEIFCTCPDRPWGSSSLLYNGYRVFPGYKERPGRDAVPSHPSSVFGHERVELYLYSPYGPHGLYKASVHVQGCIYLFLVQTQDTRWKHLKYLWNLFKIFIKFIKIILNIYKIYFKHL
jgi:hypothetical protein